MVSGEIGPEQVSGTVECTRTSRAGAAASLRRSLRDVAAGWALADGLVVADGFTVAVFAGLAAVALLVAADAAGAGASPTSANPIGHSDGGGLAGSRGG